MIYLNIRQTSLMALLGGLVIVLGGLLAVLGGVGYPPRAARADIPIPPTIIIKESTAHRTPITHRAMGTPQAELFTFTILNSQSTSTPPHDGEDVFVHAIKLTLTNNNPIDADILPNPTLRNFRLYDLDTGLAVGSVIDRAIPSPRMGMHILDFTHLDFNLPYGVTRRFILMSEVTSLSAGAISGSIHSADAIARPEVVATPIEAVGLTTGLAATNEGNISGTIMIVYANVLRAAVNPASPIGLVGRGSNKVIAMYNLWRDPYGATPPDTLAGEWLNVTAPLFMNAPYAVRVYRDSVSPATLLGSQVRPAGWFIDARPSLPVITVSNPPEAPLRIIVTLDTTHAASGTFQPSLAHINWTDGISFLTSVQDLPLWSGPLTIN